MSKSNGVPTMVVVGLGMILIAGLAAVAAWAWSHRRGPLLHTQRQRRSEEAEMPDTPQGSQAASEATEGTAENGAGAATA